MNDEIYATLLRFHREVFLPDLERLFAPRLRKHDDWDAALRSRVFNGQLQGLEVEHYLLRLTVERFEAELEGAVYQPLDDTRPAVREHLEALASLSIEERLDRLQIEHTDLSRRVAALEPRITPASRRIYNPLSNLADLRKRMSALLAASANQ